MLSTELTEKARDLFELFCRPPRNRTGLSGFPGGSDSKESACSSGDLGLIPELGRSPEEGTGNPLQYSCLENSMDRGAWWATVHGVAKSHTQPSNTHIHC